MDEDSELSLISSIAYLVPVYAHIDTEELRNAAGENTWWVREMVYRSSVDQELEQPEGTAMGSTNKDDMVQMPKFWEQLCAIALFKRICEDKPCFKLVAIVTNILAACGTVYA